jgi:hypothetical protein
MLAGPGAKVSWDLTDMPNPSARCLAAISFPNTRPQKTWTNHFDLNHSFIAKYIPWKKTTSPPTACLASFFDEDNFIITLLQSIIIFVLANSKRVNSKNSTPFNFCYNDIKYKYIILLTYFNNHKIFLFSNKNNNFN